MARKAAEKTEKAVKSTANKTAETAAPKKAAAKKPAAKKKVEPVLKTVVQVGGKEFDVSNIAANELKKYKSVHKKKAVTEFAVYVKPEENAAYFTVNGEGSDDFKIEL